MQHEQIDRPLQKWQEATWLLIALLTPLFVNFWVEQQFEATKVWLLRLLVGILAIIWLAGGLSGLRQKPPPPAIRNLTIALVLILSLSTLLSPNHYIATFGTLDRADGLLTQLSYLLLFWVVASQIDGNGSRQLLSVIILTAVPICLIGLAQAAGWQPLPVLTDARTNLVTTLGRANFTGAYLALLLPLTLTAFMTSEKDRWRRIGYGLLSGLEIIVITLTQARAAWIAAVVGVILLLWLHYAPRFSARGRRLSGLGGAAVLIGALLLVLQRGIAGGGSIAARWTIWQASLRLLWPRLWLGYGADTLELHFPAVYPPQLVYYQGRGIIVDRAHNWLLDRSLNYGFVAMLIFAILVTIILWQAWKRLITRPTNNNSQLNEARLENHWLAACIAAVSAQLVGNLFLFEVASTAVVFWLLLAVLTAATTVKMPRNKPPPWPLWLRGVALITAVFVVGWLVWLGSLRPLIADVHSWRATNALNQGNVLAAITGYETAVKYQPQETAYLAAEALTAAQLDNFEQAETAMKKAILIRPTDPVLYTQLAAIYSRQSIQMPEKITLAYLAYEQAISLAPTIALTYQQYADLALRAGDGETARLQAQKAVNLDATDGLSFGIMGWAQLQAGELPAAESAFEQAVKWQPDSADFHLGLATVYYQQGRLDAAHQALEQSLVRNPSYQPSLALQSQLQDN